MTVLKELDEAVLRRVSVGFREGRESLDIAPYERPVSSGREVAVDELTAVLDEVQSRFSKPAESDAWLGPRVHAALRLTRREAAAPGVWKWLGLGLGADYIRWRFAERKHPRFVGAYHLHGLGRIWWMAELFRNGENYSSAVMALRNQDIPQNFLRMDIAHHRPTCQAFLTVESKREGRTPLTGREANALAKAANCAATTIAFETVAPDVALDADARMAWVESEVDIVRHFDDLPPGPPDPPVPTPSIGRMTSLLSEIFKDAPVRGQETDTELEVDQEAASEAS